MLEVMLFHHIDAISREVVVRNTSVSPSPILGRNEKVEQHVRKKDTQIQS